MIDNLLKGDSTDSEELPSLHGSDELSLTDFIVDSNWEEINPAIHDVTIFQENIIKGSFVVANFKRGVLLVVYSQ